MKVPPPEKRKCEQCLNEMTLNLFRLNSSKCRYCQDELPVPPRLVNEIPKSDSDDSLNLDTNTNYEQKNIDSNASKDLSQAMEFTLNLIPPKPDWVLWAYLGGGLLVLIIIGIIALRFVRASG